MISWQIPNLQATSMVYQAGSALLAVTAIALFGCIAKADAPKQLKTENGKPVILGNFLNAPTNCGSNPGPVPLPRLREKPSHGTVGLQIVITEVAASDSCPTRKVPAIALFYTPRRDFVGNDSVQVEFEAGDDRVPPGASFLITVQGTDGK
jgi:hypothetical protein